MQQRRIIPIILVYTLFAFGCEHTKIEEPDPADANELISAVNSAMIQDSVSSLHTAAGAASLWNSFEETFKACLKNSSFNERGLFSKYKLLYLGPSNTRYLGSIYSRNGVEPKTELTKFIDSVQLASFSNKGVDVPETNLAAMRDQYLSIALGRLPFTNSDTTLRFILSNQDTMINTIGSWSIDGLNNSEFVKFLEENSSNPNIKFYHQKLVEKNNIVSFQVASINGFSTDIISNRDLNIGVDLEIPVMTTKTVSGKDSILCSLSFKKKNNRTVHLKSNGKFYAFALAMKGKKVN